MQGLNTISHEDENKNPNGMRVNTMGESLNLGVRKTTSSQKRPGTAKPRKGGLMQAGKPPLKKNNFVSGTPSNRIKSAKGSMFSNTHGMVVPQQS